MDLNLARDAKNNKKGSTGTSNSKERLKETILPLRSENRELVSTNQEKAEVLNMLPQSSLAILLCPPTKLMDHKMQTSGIKSSLSGKIKLRMT